MVHITDFISKRSDDNTIAQLNGTKAYIISSSGDTAEVLQGIIIFREYVNGLEPKTYDVEVIDTVHNKLSITTYNRDGDVIMQHPEVTDLTNFPVSGAPLLMDYLARLNLKDGQTKFSNDIITRLSSVPLLVKQENNGQDFFTFGDTTKAFQDLNIKENENSFEKTLKEKTLLETKALVVTLSKDITADVISAADKTAGKEAAKPAEPTTEAAGNKPTDQSASNEKTDPVDSPKEPASTAAQK
ncbi:hypothetical protein OF375_02610 [Ureaplasma miroungigenitalium]|uniref:hypothetical protein n=1 Tax=Ureaplasma miroungigenitalium TaxID=1042321 RepID=UPI0021E837F9|nr:hypothetical protein [Ureaplasma miroungigenitalium]MCV3734457.1 hypothetical protein [Ureaplasma miroungigenitalium]